MHKKRSIIIRISNEGVFFNPTLSLSLHHSNIPKESLSFTNAKSIYWEVEMISFEKETSTLELKVIDYNSENWGVFVDQQPKHEVKNISFQPFHWHQFQYTLSSFKKVDLLDIITDELWEGPAVSKPFELEFSIPLAKLEFGHGRVSFRKNFKWNYGSDLFTIPHHEVIPEYNFIKQYFKKVIGKGTVDIKMEIRSSTDETIIQKISSIDITKINAKSIQILKIQKFKDWATQKPKIEDGGRILLDFEELMDSHGDGDFGNIDIFEKDFLFHILEEKQIRNQLQLQYLSASVHASRKKLLMTLAPQFGFVFCHQGEEMDHYIWELLDSHATYVWSIPKIPFLKAARKIENEIRTISELGRSQYRAHFNNTSDLYFNLVIHKDNTSSYEVYFPKWKLNLDRLLI